MPSRSKGNRIISISGAGDGNRTHVRLIDSTGLNLYRVQPRVQLYRPREVIHCFANHALRNVRIVHRRASM